MADVSPVLAAFLEGQRTRSEVLSRAHQAKQQSEAQALRQKQLDETIRQFNERLKQQDKEHQLKIDLYNLNRQIHQGELTKFFTNAIAQGSIAAPPEPTAPGIAGNIPGIPSQNTEFNPEVNTPLGPVQVPRGIQTPEMRLPGMIEQTKALTEAEQGVKSKYEMMKVNASNEARTNQLMERLASAEQMAKERNASNQLIAELRAQVAGANSAQMASLRLIGMFGSDDPNQIKENAITAWKAMEHGADPKTLGNQHVIGLASQYGRSLGRTAVSPKDQEAIDKVNAGASSLLARVDDIAKAIAAPPKTSSLLGNLVGRYNVRSQINQKTKEAETLIPQLAHSMGINNKQIDSNQEGQRFLNNLPKYNDTPEQRWDKLINLRDIPLSALQSTISKLPNVEQRRERWAEVIQNNRSIFTREEYMPVAKKIMETGNYQSSYWDPIRSQNIRGKK